TGAVSMVKAEAIENRPITNVTTGLQGLLPGVSIVSSSGQPGAVPSINIRGTGTINSSTAPLILIDGVAGGDINLLNPSDIESVSVLKDAASSAIYGARAANGVILVTTKKGEKKERVVFQYNGYAGFQTPTALPELVNGREYMELSNEAMSAAGFSKPYTQEAFDKYDSGLYPNEYSNTDWIDEIYKSRAFQTGHNVSARGGSEKTGFFMSYGFLDQDGLVVGDGYSSKRHNARISVNTEVYDRLKLTGQMSYVDFYKKDLGYSGTSGVFRLSQRMSPLLPVMWQIPDENGRMVDSENWSYGSVRNPLQVAYESGMEERKTRVLNGIFNADLKIIDGLNVGMQYSANIYTRQVDEFNPKMLSYYSDGSPLKANEDAKDYISQSHLDVMTQTLQFTMNFNRTIGRHELGALMGFSQEWENRSTLGATRDNVMVEDIHVISAGMINFMNSGTKDEWALRSYFGRVNYAFDGKYLFEANLRADGTSRFAKGNRWGYFPSFSAGWNFSREKFMEFATSVLSSGKLRASWGELGNQNIPGNYYPYLSPIITEESYPIGASNTPVMGLWQNKIGNPDIKWETIRMLNFGVDLSFLNNRLNVDFDWYKKENIDALVRPDVPAIVGVSSSNVGYVNLGKIDVKGWELNLSWRDKIGSVNYNLGFNLSDARNKITDLGGTPESLTSTASGSYRRVGDPIGAFYGYLTDGLAQVYDFESVNTTTGKYKKPKFPLVASQNGIVQPGDIKYRDISGPDGAPDGVIDDYDKVVFGEKEPHYTYAIKGGLEWKGIDFSFYLQGVGKVAGYLEDEARHAFINDYSIPKKEHLDRWTPMNPNASYPRLYQSQEHNRLFSDYWKEDASYLRLKNIQIGYRFPARMVAPLGINSLRVYASADNLFTKTDYFGAYDPEVRTTSGDVYPQVKTYVFGLSITF
ncbi:SusC/RagA family TonB-linked outer membrane protein, partial [Bacteroides xylanisolvens]